MKFVSKLVILSLLATALSFHLVAQEPVDHEMIAKIRDEGLNRSQVMQILQPLSEDIGPRLTATPAMKRANFWTKNKLESWGLTNAHLERTPFGRGWTINNYSITMLAPRFEQLQAVPLAWFPSTKGPISADVVYAPMRSVDDFEKYQGTLKGKIVLVSTVVPPKQPIASNSPPSPPAPDAWLDNWVDRKNFVFELHHFLSREGALLMVQRSFRKYGLVGGVSYQYQMEGSPEVAGIELASEHYTRMVRLIENNQKVQLAVDISAQYHDDDPYAYSTFAEIRGVGENPEVVMAGAHLDSWAYGDGASDNAAGVAVVMEAVRILKALGVKPKRTIRVALWGGEEQGYFGSHAYVSKHFADRPARTDNRFRLVEPYSQQFGLFPIEIKQGHGKLSAYFNLDNGNGKILGIRTENNEAIVPIFKDWLEPFADLDTGLVSLAVSNNTDHEPFDDVGLPGFQFIQKRSLNIGPKAHTVFDNFELIHEDDLKQASVIMASFLYHAAMRDELLPRKAFPTE